MQQPPRTRVPPKALGLQPDLRLRLANRGEGRDPALRDRFRRESAGRMAVGGFKAFQVVAIQFDMPNIIAPNQRRQLLPKRRRIPVSRQATHLHALPARFERFQVGPRPVWVQRVVITRGRRYP